jgi:branched-chain amino acid transport system permease protein
VAVYLNIVASGLLTGLVYGLAALGLSVIFGVVRVVNFAHGEMMVIGMYGAVVLAGWPGLDPLVAAPLVAALLFAIGYALQRGVINAFIARPEHMQFILLVGVALMIVNGLLMVFGPDARSTNVEYGFETFEVGPLLLDKARVYAAGAAVLTTAALFGFFRYSRPGKAIRACADNQLGAKVVGLDVEGLYALTFGLGAACVGIAGCLMALVIDVRSQLAPEYTLLSFIIVIIGGLGSLAGALLGGVLIGISEALAGFFLLPSMKSMFSYALLILVLVLRPQGLLGKRA